jgi:hypothetical protein
MNSADYRWRAVTLHYAYSVPCEQVGTRGANENQYTSLFCMALTALVAQMIDIFHVYRRFMWWLELGKQTVGN